MSDDAAKADAWIAIGGLFEVGFHDERIEVSVNNEGRHFDFIKSLIVEMIEDDLIHRAPESWGFDILATKTTKPLNKIGHDTQCRLIFGEAVQRAIGFGVDFVRELRELFGHENGRRN